MKKLVMTVEMKEVDVMDPSVAENTGESFARIADVLMHVRTKMYDPPMTFDEYVDELQRISDLIVIEGYVSAMESMYNLAEIMDPNLSTILDAYIMHDEAVIVPFLDYFFNQITLSYQTNRIFETHDEEDERECACDCCDCGCRGNELTAMLDKAYFMLKGLLNREVKTDEENKSNCHM